MNHTINLTDKELELLARLVGHHTTGNAFERVYDQLHDKVRDHLALDVAHLPPLPNSQKGVNSEMYGDRAMVKVDHE